MSEAIRVRFCGIATRGILTGGRSLIGASPCNCGELGTGAEDIPKQLGPVSFELGVIAGTSSINLILSNFLPNPDDGKVSVENTKVQGMCGLVTVDVSHPFLMKRQQVINQVLHFLRSGSFFGDNAQQFACPAQLKPKLS